LALNIRLYIAKNGNYKKVFKNTNN